MGAVGIVAEYNPLHNGHIYHLEQAKKETGADFCVIAMSGNFVQRGEPACADKFTRAEWALRAGADLIVEIPQCLAVASAERFAEGAVKLLAETGVVTDIAFGVETDKTLSLIAVSPDLKSVIVKSTSHSRMRVFAVSGENYDVVSEYSLACDTSGTAQGQLLPDAKLLLFAHCGEASFSLVSFGQNSSDVPWEYGNAVVTLFSVENGSIVPKENKRIPCCCTSDPRFDCLTASPDKLICKQRYTDVYYFVLDLITGEQKQIYIDSLRLGGSDFRNAIGLSASCLELLRRAGILR